MEPATAGDSILQARLSPVITGLNHDLRLPWGSRPSLYAYACFAGWAIVQNSVMWSLLARIDFLCKAARKGGLPPLLTSKCLVCNERG